jgi:hypothetical protein
VDFRFSAARLEIEDEAVKKLIDGTIVRCQYNKASGRIVETGHAH